MLLIILLQSYVDLCFSAVHDMAGSKIDKFDGDVLHNEEITLVQPIEETTSTKTRVQEIIVSGGKQEWQLGTSFVEDKRSEAARQMSSEKETSKISEEELLRDYVLISEEETIICANTDRAVLRDTVARGKWKPKACFKRLKDKVLSKFDKHSKAGHPPEVDQQFEAHEGPEIEKSADKWNLKSLDNDAELSSSIVCEESGEQ